MNRLADEAAYFGAVQDGIDSQQERITELEQQIAIRDAQLLKNADILGEAADALDNKDKQIVMLRTALVNAHEFIGDSVESYETAKQRIEALSATQDFKGCIICDAEPVGITSPDYGTGLCVAWVTGVAFGQPVFKAKEMK